MIEAYVALYNANNKVLILPSTTSYNILLNKHFEINNQLYLSEEDLTKYSFVVGTVLVNSNHWNCFLANLQINEFFYLDPKTKDASNAEEAFKNWQEFMTRKNIKTVWRLGQIDNLSLQKSKDTYNCGVYVCQYLKLLIQSKTNLCFVTKNTLSQLDVVRSEMFNEFKHKITN